MNDILAMPSKRPRRRKRRTLRAIAVLLGSFVVFAGLVALVSFQSGNREMDRLMAEIRAKGEPLTAEEMKAWRPKVPEDRNAAVRLNEWSKRFPTSDKALQTMREQIRLLESDEVLNVERQKEIDSFIGANTEYIKDLHELLQIEGADYSVLAYSASQFYSYNQAVERAETILQLNADYAIANRQPDEALERMRDLLRLAHTLRNESSQMGQETRTSIQSGAVAVLRRMLEHGKPSESALIETDKSLAEERDTESFYRAAIGARASIVDRMQHAGERGESWRGQMLTPMGLSFTTKVVDAARLPVQKRQAAIREIGADLRRYRAAHPIQVYLAGRYQQRVSEPLMESHARFGLGLMRIDMARAAIAIERFRIKNGRLPESLEETVPEFLEELPQDLFLPGKALQYRAVGLSYGIYKGSSDYHFDVEPVGAEVSGVHQ